MEIGNAQKTFFSRQRALAQSEVEIAQLKSVNRDAKVALMKALIERDEYLTKKSALRTNNERLTIQNENFHKAIDDLLQGDEVDSICERFSFSEQVSLLKDIQDARCKLLKYGFPLSFFA